MNWNSVRNRPTPSAPLVLKLRHLHQQAGIHQEIDPHAIPAQRRLVAHIAIGARALGLALDALFIGRAHLLGRARMQQPNSPSMISGSPSSTRSSAPSIRPTMGTPSALATMAAWELELPSSSAMPAMRERSNPAIRPDRSSARSGSRSPAGAGLNIFRARQMAQQAVGEIFEIVQAARGNADRAPSSGGRGARCAPAPPPLPRSGPRAPLRAAVQPAAVIGEQR
jgi:hypothetical protein